jgi:hypothetical protein
MLYLGNTRRIGAQFIIFDRHIFHITRIKLSISRLKMVVSSVLASNEPLRLANLRFSFLAIR